MPRWGCHLKSPIHTLDDGDQLEPVYKKGMI